MGKINNLFTKYSGTYSTKQDGAERGAMDARGQRKTSRHELRGFDGEGAPRVSKRGGNFLDRVVCWFEERVFSLTRSGKHPSPRQETSAQFAADVKGALAEIGLNPPGGEDAKPHDLVQRIESIQKRDLPLRSGFVRSVLQEVAGLAHGTQQQALLPGFARGAFPNQQPNDLIRQDVVVPQPGLGDAVEQREMNLFANMSDRQFHEMLSRRVEESVIGPHLAQKDFGQLHERAYIPENIDLIVTGGTDSLLEEKFGKEGTLQAAKRRADELNNGVDDGGKAAMAGLCDEICRGNEPAIVNFVDQYLQDMHDNIMRGQRRQPVLAPEGLPDRDAEPFRFANQNDDVFKGKLREPVKAKLVNPVLRDQGFYGGEMTAEKTELADKIVSVVINDLVADVGSLENTKRKADEALALLELAADPGIDLGLLPNQALDAVVDGFLGTAAGERAKGSVKEEFDIERRRQAPPPQEIPEEAHEVIENEQFQFNEGLQQGQPEGIQAQAVEQKGAHGPASFRDMPVAEFLARFSDQVKAQYVIPELRRQKPNENYSPDVAQRNEIITANATARFVAGAMGCSAEQFKEKAADAYEVERGNYNPGTTERVIQDNVLKGFCTKDTDREQEWMFQQVRVAFQAYQAGPEQGQVDIGQMILEKIAPAAQQVPAPELQTGGDNEVFNYGGPNRGLNSSAENFQLPGSIQQEANFNQPVGPGAGRGQSPLSHTGGQAVSVPQPAQHTKSIPDEYKQDMLGNFMIELVSPEVRERLRAVALEKGQESGYDGAEIDTQGSPMNTAFEGLLAQGKHADIGTQLLGAAIDKHNNDLAEGRPADWDIAGEREKATRVLVQQFAFEFAQNLANK